MAVNGVGFNAAYVDRVGVDRNGKPVVYNLTQEEKNEMAKIVAQRRIQEIINSGRSINPAKDKVFVDPRTGELTTIKPGIFDPESQKRNAERRSKVANLLLAGSAIGAAVVFRKPIAKALTGAMQYVKPLITKGVEFVKNSSQGLIAKVISFFGKKAV